MADDPAPAEAPAAPPTDDGVEQVQAEGTERISAREAAKALSSYRGKRDKDRPEAAPAPVERPIPEPRAAKEAAEEEITAEESDTPEGEPIEAPKSWSKEWKEEFATYPRSVQEKIAQREQERDTATRRGQNEVAEQRKALEAERVQNTTARQQYEAALPALLQELYTAQAGAFPDIKTQADVEKMAREDWPRYAQYDAHLKKIANIQQQNTAAQQRQYQEYQTQWGKFAKDEDQKFLDASPDMANKETADKVSRGAITLLEDMGFSQEDLGKLWSGQASVSLRDHRLQLIIRDALRYREAKTAVPKAKVAPVAPRVQRPGSPVERVRDSERANAALDKRLDSTGSWKDAAELLMARRRG